MEERFTQCYQEALETIASMGSFAGANYDSILFLNKEVKGKEQELQRSKQDQAQGNIQHQHELQDLKDEYEEKLKQLHDQNDLLKQKFEYAQGLNSNHTQRIATLEEKLEQF